MLDTIRLIFFFEDDVNALDRSFGFLEDNFSIITNSSNPNNYMDNDTLYRLYFIKNMFIKLYQNRVVLQGSINSYYKGNNLVELNDDETVKAFEQIRFQLPFVNWYESIVSRLDLGVCFCLPFDPNIIARYITGSKHKNKMTYKSDGESTIVGNKSHQFEIYNKTEESDSEEDNVLRLEYKMLKASMVRKKFNNEPVTLNHLLNNLHRLPKIWYDMYQELEKDYSPIFDTISSKHELDHAAYHRLGYERSMSIIENSYEKKSITLTQKYNMKRYVRNLQREGKNFASPYSPMLVLDKAVDKYMIEKNKVVTW